MFRTILCTEGSGSSLTEEILCGKKHLMQQEVVTFLII